MMLDFLNVMADHLDDEVILNHLAQLVDSDILESPSSKLKIVARKINENDRTVSTREEFRDLLKRHPYENIEDIMWRVNRTMIPMGNPFSWITRDDLKNKETRTLVFKYLSLKWLPVKLIYGINRLFYRIGWHLKLNLLQKFVKRQLNLPNTKHTFISFNYDLTLDRSLQMESKGKWDISYGYGFPINYYLPTCVADEYYQYESNQLNTLSVEVQQLHSIDESEKKIQLLKPHGSLNWLIPYTYEDDYIFSNEPVIAVLDKQLQIAYSPLADFRNGTVPSLSSKSDLMIFIAPPLEEKIGYMKFIQEVKESECNAFIEADEIYIIGWSMPATDEDQRSLIQSSMKKRAKKIKNICVINYNADPDYFHRISEVFDINENKLSVFNNGFEDYLISSL